MGGLQWQLPIKRCSQNNGCTHAHRNTCLHTHITHDETQDAPHIHTAAVSHAVCPALHTTDRLMHTSTRAAAADGCRPPSTAQHGTASCAASLSAMLGALTGHCVVSSGPAEQQLTPSRGRRVRHPGSQPLGCPWLAHGSTPTCTSPPCR